MVITDFLVLLKLSDSVLKLADSVKESNQLHLDSKVLKNKSSSGCYEFVLDSATDVWTLLFVLCLYLHGKVSTDNNEVN